MNLRINKHFSSVAYPPSNAQVEVLNKTIKNNMDRKLARARGVWANEFPKVLWVY